MSDLLNYRTFGLKNEVVHHLFILSVASWKDQLMGVIAYKFFSFKAQPPGTKVSDKGEPSKDSTPAI
jgi:hypothetical protein